jgi:hypothetical protein
MEERIPRKKGFSYKNVRINSRAKVVDIEDSDDERKMPAKASKKKKKADIEPMDTDEEEEIDNKPTKEERAFLRSIAKEEDDSSDSE